MYLLQSQLLHMHSGGRAKAGGPGFNLCGYPGVFSSSWLTHVDGMKCPSTVQPWTRMNIMAPVRTGVSLNCHVESWVLQGYFKRVCSKVMALFAQTST